MIRTATNPTLEEKEQYHHYIPRFVLRAFAAQPQPDYSEPSRPVRKRRKQRKKKPAKITAGDTEDPKGVEDDSPDEGGPSNAPKEPEPRVETEVTRDTGKPKPRKPRFNPDNDPYIKFYDLESGVLDFAKVGKSYGIPDMYKDADHERVYHIEDLLSKLESSAAIIYHRIRKDHESGKSNFSMTRKDRNLLRKFIFVMKYRSYKFWSKYSGTIDTYEHSDRDRLLRFLEERSITNLRQVWLLNLEVILRTEIDPDGEWLKTIGREMFGDDANMYVHHMSESYMAFCEPQSPEDEFILTNNGFGIFEGHAVYNMANPKSADADSSSPRLDDPKYTEFHKLAPLSPRLILVLRSNFLREGPIWERRKKFATQCGAQPNVDSILQDLPIKPPETRYWLLPVKSEPVRTLEDEFFFEIYKLKTKQIHLINALMLEEATRSITWVSDESLVGSLHAFLGDPNFELAVHMAVLPEFALPIQLRFQKQRLLNLWDKPYPTEGRRPIEELNKRNEALRKNKDLQPYYKLGGTPELFLYDSLQGSLLTQFRTFIADNSGHDIPWGNKVNRATIKFMSTFHPRIVWHHIKKWKVLANRVLGGLELNPLSEADFDILGESGPEDLIANLVEVLPFRLLSRLMLETTLKGMLRLDRMNELSAQQVSEKELEAGMMYEEIDLMRQFGGFGGSWFLVGTPYHTEPVDFCDPFRPDISPDLLLEFYKQDLALRFDLYGKIEKMILGARGTLEVRQWLSQLLWDHLYQIPTTLLNRQKAAGRGVCT